MEFNALNLFGLAAVGFTLLCYARDDRAPIWTLGFAFGSALSSVYGFAQGAWPFGLIEVFWTIVAILRWRRRAVVDGGGASA